MAKAKRMKTKITKTKVGSEYRVRNTETGQIHGEFNRLKAARKRMGKIIGGKKSD